MGSASAGFPNLASGSVPAAPVASTASAPVTRSPATAVSAATVRPQEKGEASPPTAPSSGVQDVTVFVNGRYWPAYGSRKGRELRRELSDPTNLPSYLEGQRNTVLIITRVRV
jgi:hypothetical protein